MAYITTEQVKERRNELKKHFPAAEGWKFSVKRLHASKIHVTILSAPINLMEDNDSGREYFSVNQFYINEKNYPNHYKTFEKIEKIANAGHWDDSDSMTDYFNCSWYFSLNVGSFEKAFVHKPQKEKVCEVWAEVLNEIF